MKIEKITENKIRIIIDTNELIEKNLNLNSIVKNTDAAQELFKSILEEAKKQVGFVVNDSKLLVEAYATQDGFFIITFTKFKNSDINTNSNTSKKVYFKRKMPNNTQKNAIYEFKNFDEFCFFCTYANNSKLCDLKGFAKNISLYEYNFLYYLVLSNINTDFKYLNLFYTSISEFAKLISNSSLYKSKLDEHGKIIFKTNAIKNGIKYFSEK